MQVQFQCPSCQTSLQADASQDAVEAQCPKCGTRFMVDTRTALLPQVQAVAAPPAPTAAMMAQERRRKAKEARERQQRADRRKVMALLIGGPVALGCLYWGGLHLTKAKASEAERWSSGKAAQVMEVVRVQVEETRLVEEAEAKRSAGIQRERVAALEAAERKERARQRAVLVSMVSREIFDGDDAAADAMVTEMEAVQEEIIATFNDGIAGNEPTSAADLEKMIIGRLLPRLLLNPVIMRSARNRPPQDLARTLMRRTPLNEGPGAMPEIFRSGKYNNTGTAFWISADGWLITNHHVVDSSKEVDLRMVDGKVIQARVVRTDEKNDLALLKAATTPPAWLPVSKGEKEVGLGQMVFTMGYPNAMVQGLEPKWTDGKISSRSGLRDDRNFYQTSVPVQPGNSGGPLVDSGSGWVVGVFSKRLDQGMDGRSAQSVSYAIKGSVVNTFLSGTPEAVLAMGKQPPQTLKPGDAEAITERTRLATALVLVAP